MQMTFFFHSDFVCFECTPRSGIANHMTVRTYHTVFHNSYANLFPPKKHVGIPLEHSYRGVSGVEGATRNTSVDRSHGTKWLEL